MNELLYRTKYRIRKITGKKELEAPTGEGSRNYLINIKGKEIDINGRSITLPLPVKELEQILGKPRAVEFPLSDKDKEALEQLHEMHGKAVLKKVNYFWDDLGLMCYTNDGETAYCFGIKFRLGDYGKTAQPKSLYAGRVTINGRPWFPIMMAGEDCEVFRRVVVDGCYLTAEYADFFQSDKKRTEADFTGVEVQMMDN